jgi:hypothetical protein
MNRRNAVSAALGVLAPRIPDHEKGEVIEHALSSRGLRHASPETAVWLSLVSYIRHVLTDYDEMLDDGYDIESARHFCLDPINDVLAEWGSPRQVSGEEEEADED